MKKTVVISVLILLVMNSVFAKTTAKGRADKIYKDCPNIVRDFQYKTVQGFEDAEQLSMDLILPEKNLYKNGAPVVLYIHGGGWSGGERYVLENLLKDIRAQ